MNDMLYFLYLLKKLNKIKTKTFVRLPSPFDLTFKFKCYAINNVSLQVISLSLTVTSFLFGVITGSLTVD